MERRSLNAAQLASALGTDRTTVAHWLAGDRRPDAATVERIALVLAVPPGELLYGPEVEP